jgi:hypothetical protein
MRRQSLFAKLKPQKTAALIAHASRFATTPVPGD